MYYKWQYLVPVDLLNAVCCVYLTAAHLFVCGSIISSVVSSVVSQLMFV